MKIAILGTGMQGLIAAHAVSEFSKVNWEDGHDIVMYGPNRTPIVAGARFYEREIPGLEIPVRSRMVTTESSGKADDYVTKVGHPITKYFKARPSFLAFDYHHTHRILHDMYSDEIIQLSIDKELFETSLWDDCDYVINTMPRAMFYGKEDHPLFAATRHWRIDEEGDKMPYSIPDGNVDKQLMIFDGTEDTSWFRITQLFGLISVEWGFHKKPPIAGTYMEVLPLAVPEEMGLANVVPGWKGTRALAHVGAFARWEPSTDVAEVFSQTQSILKGEWSDADEGRRN